MSVTDKFLVPDYYERFSCKCGECRNTCCSSWGISLSMSEYFTMLGRECSPELRRILDTAFHIADNPTPERYALAVPRYDGHCRLHGEDGYCMLQRECGESAISSVCRCYPRAPRISPACECSSSASCERVLELLFESDEPLGFCRQELSFDLELDAGEQIDDYSELRAEAFARLGDRSIGLTERINRLGEWLFAREGIENSLADEPCDAAVLLEQLLCELARTSAAIERLNDIVAHSIILNEGTASLDSTLEGVDIKLEKLIVNHLFYKAFPLFTGVGDGFIALAGVYSLTRLVAAAYMREHSGLDAFIDVLAELYRVLEHSDFDRCAVSFFKKHRLDTPARLRIITEF